MKRILSLFIALVLILSTFASCELFPSETTKVEEANIEEAVKQLRDMYKDLNGTSIQNGKELVAQVKVGKTVFSVAWTSSDARITVEVVDGLAIVNIPNDIKENAKLCYAYKVNTQTTYSYSLQTIDFIVEEIKKDPENIIQNLKNSIKK